MTEKNIFSYIFCHQIFMWKFQPPTEKKVIPLFISNLPLKVKVLPRCPPFWKFDWRGSGGCTLCGCLYFFGFLRPDLSPWGYWNRCFLVALCRLIVRRPNFIPLDRAISGGVDISEVPGCHLLWKMCSQWGWQKLLQGLVSHELIAYLSIFNQFICNELWPYYQKHANQIILNRASL